MGDISAYAYSLSYFAPIFTNARLKRQVLHAAAVQKQELCCASVGHKILKRKYIQCVSKALQISIFPLFK